MIKINTTSAARRVRKTVADSTGGGSGGVRYDINPTSRCLTMTLPGAGPAGETVRVHVINADELSRLRDAADQLLAELAATPGPSSGGGGTSGGPTSGGDGA